jgi:hypothetical protein
MTITALPSVAQSARHSNPLIRKASFSVTEWVSLMEDPDIRIKLSRLRVCDDGGVETLILLKDRKVTDF